MRVAHLHHTTDRRRGAGEHDSQLPGIDRTIRRRSAADHRARIGSRRQPGRRRPPTRDSAAGHPAIAAGDSPWRDWRAIRQSSPDSRAYAPDVVHTHSGKAGLLGRVAARRVGVRAIVHTVHGAPFHRYQSRLARSFFRRCEIVAARRCDAIISVADAMTDQLVAAGVAPREKFIDHLQRDGSRTLPRAPNSTRAAAGRTSVSSPMTSSSAKIARLFHLKGHDDVIAAARPGGRP